MKSKSPAAELAGFIAKYRPEIQTQARAAHARLRRRLPRLIEMVYDNYNGLVIGFGPTERPSEALFSLVLFPKWLTLASSPALDCPILPAGCEAAARSSGTCAWAVRKRSTSPKSRRSFKWRGCAR